MKKDRTLKDCPSSPNCVSSQSDSEKHNISPISYSGSTEHAFNTILKMLHNTPRTEIVDQDAVHYIHAICKTKWLRAKNDIEFLFDGEKKVIDVRSASRIGYSDLSVNRKRVEKMRRQFIHQV